MEAGWAPNASTRARLRRLSEVAALVFTVVLRTWITRDRVMYTVTADEASQLAMARTLSGSRPFHVIGSAFDAGYAVLVSPAFLVTDDPSRAFRLALLLNVVLAAIALLALRSLLVRVLDVDGPTASWASAIALAMPGAAMQTPWTASEGLIVVVLALALVLAVSLDGPRGGWSAVGLALVGASMLLVHARLTLAAVAVLVILVVSALVGQTSREVAAGAVVLMVVLGWGALQFNDWVYDLVWLPVPSSSSQFQDIVARLDQPGAILASATGMAWHQMVTTFGLVWVGLFHLVRTGVRRNAVPRIGPREWQRWSILAVLVAAAGPAIVFLADRELAGQMVYGRYWDAVAIPVVAIAAAWLVSATRGERWRALVVAMVLTAATAVMFSWSRQDVITTAQERFGFGNPRRIAGLLAFVAPGGRINVLLITAMSLAVVGIVVAVVALAGNARVVVAGALVVVAGAATVEASIHLNDAGLGITRWAAARELVDGGTLPDDAQVAFRLDRDVWEPDPRFPFTAYQFHEPKVSFVGLRGEAVLGYEWVVSDVSDPLLSARDWEVVFVDPDGQGAAIWTPP